MDIQNSTARSVIDLLTKEQEVQRRRGTQNAFKHLVNEAIQKSQNPIIKSSVNLKA